MSFYKYIYIYIYIYTHTHTLVTSSFQSRYRMFQLSEIPKDMGQTFFKFISAWRVIALVCCVGSYCTIWLSPEYTYSPSSRACLPPALPSHPSRSSQTTRLGSVHTAPSHQPSVLHVAAYVRATLHSSQPLLPLICPQVHALCLCLYSFPANSFISTILLDSTYMHR